MIANLKILCKGVVSMKSGFYAFSCNFQGTPGYMVKQFLNDRMVCEQFVSQEVFEEFCKAVRIVPVINNPEGSK